MRRWSLVLRPALVSLVYLAGYMALDAITEGLKGSLSFSLWFPPAGLTFALLLIFGARYAPVVALVSLLHLILFRDGLSYPVALLFAIPVCYTVLYAGASVLLVRGPPKIDPRLTGMRDVAWFVGVACFLAPLLASFEVVSGVVLAGYVPFGDFWENLLGFWAGDATGIGILASLLLVALRPFPSLWARYGTREEDAAGSPASGFRPPSRRELPEVGLQVLALALSLVLAYGGARGASLDFAYLAFAPLVWVALRGGFERTTFAVLLINIGVVVLVGGEAGGENPILLQFGLMALTLVGLLFGGQTTERLRAERALEESERRFRSVVHNSSEAVTILDPDGTVRYASPAFEWLFGYEPEEVVSKNINAYIHPEDLPRVLRGAEKALAEPGVTRNVVEHRLRHKDGSWRCVETIGTYLLDDPAVRGVVVNARDISERKEAEEDLKESEERYRAVVEQSAESIWLFDQETKRVLESNASFQEMLGYTAEELRGMTNYDFVAHSREDIDSTVQRKTQEGKPLPEERKYRRKDGTLLNVEVKGTEISYRGKKVVCSVARDLTERKEAEARLYESEERFRSAFENASTGVALVGLDNRYLKVNRALCEMLGYSEEELLQKSSLEITHPEDREKSRARTQRMLEEGEPDKTSLEKRYVRKDGSILWSLTDVSLVRDSGGAPSHFVAQYQNITERKALEERLEHQAFHDPLTDLPNRTLLMDRLRHALVRTERRGGKVAVLFVDLDDFKRVNDSLGHEAGDRFLVEVAQRLRACLRPEDTAARLGGDEFVVLLEGVEEVDGAARVAERIMEELKAPFTLNELFASASIGIALGGSGRNRPEDLLREADVAMYRAKEGGKARYAVFGNDERPTSRTLEVIEMPGEPPVERDGEGA